MQDRSILQLRGRSRYFNPALPRAVSGVFALTCLTLVIVLAVHDCTVTKPSKALVNYGSAAAVAFFIPVCARTRYEIYVAVEECRTIYLLLPFLAVAPFFITLRSPFLFDSYAHIVAASRESFAAVLSTAYAHPTTGDFFFRPLGYLDYWLESKWCGFSPLWWHVDGLVLHAIAIYLVLLLCRRLGLSLAASSAAALLFGIHGENPEVVSWTAARFDQLATVFVLLTLIFLCEYAEGRRTYLPMICVCICALLSKESAFCIPALAACCLWFRGKIDKPGLRALAGLCAVSVVLFLYRYWVIGGIGGYRDTSGAPSFLHFNMARFLDIVAFRMWGVLALPVNWSIRPQAWVFTAILIWGMAVLTVAKVSRPVLRRMLAAIAFCVLALLPAISLARRETDQRARISSGDDWVRAHRRVPV